MLTLDELAREQYPNLLKLARVMVGRNDAEDLVQETMLAAVEAWPRFRGDADPKTWLIAILRRQLANMIRRMKIRRTVKLPRELQIGNPGDDLEPVALEANLRRLSPAHRDALAAFYVDGLSYEEIAAEAEIPVGTVRSRLSEAKANLKKLLEEAA